MGTEAQVKSALLSAKKKQLRLRAMVPGTFGCVLLGGLNKCLLHSGALLSNHPPLVSDTRRGHRFNDSTLNVTGSSSASSFVCLPPAADLPPPAVLPRHMNPLVVFAQERTGSNLLFDMFDKWNILAEEKVHPYDVEIWPLYELFANYDHEDWRLMGYAFKKLSKTCRLNNPKDLSHRNATTVPSTVFENMELLYRNRRSDPQSLLKALVRAPSVASNGAFFAFKVFSSHFKTDTFGGDIGKLIRIVRSNTISIDTKPKFIVLWRRRMIESFVSFQLAMATRQWTSNNEKAAPSPTTIKIDKSRLIGYVNRQRSYYMSVKRALEAEGDVDYLLLEYERDLLYERDQLSTIKTLEREVLETNGQSLAEATIAHLSLRKQQTQDLASLVENWEEVVQWGYGGGFEDWEDLFA